MTQTTVVFSLLDMSSLLLEQGANNKMLLSKSSLDANEPTTHALPCRIIHHGRSMIFADSYVRDDFPETWKDLLVILAFVKQVPN